MNNKKVNKTIQHHKNNILQKTNEIGLQEVFKKIFSCICVIYLPDMRDKEKLINYSINEFNDTKLKVEIITDKNNKSEIEKKYGNFNKTIKIIKNEEFCGNLNSDITIIYELYSIDLLKKLQKNIIEFKQDKIFFILTSSPFTFINYFKIKEKFFYECYTPNVNKQIYQNFYKKLIEKSNIITFEAFKIEMLDKESLNCFAKMKNDVKTFFMSLCNRHIFSKKFFIQSLNKTEQQNYINLNYESDKLQILNKILVILKDRCNCILVKDNKSKIVLCNYFDAVNDNFKSIKWDLLCLNVNCFIFTHNDLVNCRNEENFENYILFDFIPILVNKPKYVFCGPEDKILFKKLLAAEEIIELEVKPNMIPISDFKNYNYKENHEKDSSTSLEGIVMNKEIEVIFKIYMEENIVDIIQEKLKKIIKKLQVKENVILLTLNTYDPCISAFFLSRIFKIPVHHPATNKFSYNFCNFYKLSFGHLNYFDSFILEQELHGSGFIFFASKKLSIILFSKTNYKIEIDISNLEKHVFYDLEHDDLSIYITQNHQPKYFFIKNIEKNKIDEIKNAHFSKKLGLINELEWNRASLNEMKFIKNSYDIKITSNLKNIDNKNLDCDLDQTNEFLFNLFTNEKNKENKENFLLKKMLNNNNSEISILKNKSQRYKEIIFFHSLTIQAIINKIGQYNCTACFSYIKQNNRTGLSLESIRAELRDLSFEEYYYIEIILGKKERFFANKIQNTKIFNEVDIINFVFFLDASLKNRFVHLDKTFERFKIFSLKGKVCLKMKDMIRSIIITPFTVKCQYPQRITENRVLRNFNKDNIIRISFREEDGNLVKKGEKYDTTCIYDNIKRYMKEGIIIGPKRYFFLAMSSSQLKLHSAWFISPYFNDDILIGADFIRSWIGDFKAIKNIGKYAMRLGQALSSTIETITIDQIIIEDDIERNGYCFSDGIGRIDYNTALKVSKLLKIKDVPSAFQIRIGGFKGVISLYKNNDNSINSLSFEKCCSTVESKKNKFENILKSIQKLENSFNKENSKINLDYNIDKFIEQKDHKELNINDNLKEYNTNDNLKQFNTYDNLEQSDPINDLKDSDPINNFNDFDSYELHKDKNHDFNVKKLKHNKNSNMHTNCEPKKTFFMNNSKEKDNNIVFLRKSMNKFESKHKLLEVITFSQHIAGHLNRQIILILEALGIDLDIFLEMQDEFIVKLITNNKKELVSKFCSDFEFFDIQEKFFLKLLDPIIKKCTYDLVKKSKIFICKSRLLMGILDEHNVLEENQVFIQCSPCINCSCKEKDQKIITGMVAIAKNPCLHPGDVRLVECVDKKELNYLKDVVVFSAKGQRPIFNMCSGSDLDGDCYFCTWDERLLKIKTKEPDEYSANTALYKEIVSMDDIINFYIKFIRENQLGLIANAHLAISDNLKNGVSEPESIRLARLFNLGVDFPKTGFLARLPYDLHPNMYPDFMEQGNSYESQKVLGKLYRRSLVLNQIVFPDCECKGNPSSFLKILKNFTCINKFGFNNIKNHLEVKNIKLNKENKQENKLYQSDENLNNEIKKNVLISEVQKFDKETRAVFKSYKIDIKTILMRYGYNDEAEAFLGFSKEDEIDRGVCQSLRNLIKKYKNIFSRNIKGEKIIYKAFSWYKIAHENCKEENLSFAWINNEILNKNSDIFEEFKKCYETIKNEKCYVFDNKKLFLKVKLTPFCLCDKILITEDKAVFQKINISTNKNHYLNDDYIIIINDFYKRIENEISTSKYVKEIFGLFYANRIFKLDEFDYFLNLISIFGGFEKQCNHKYNIKEIFTLFLIILSKNIEDQNLNNFIEIYIIKSNLSLNEEVQSFIVQYLLESSHYEKIKEHLEDLPIKDQERKKNFFLAIVYVFNSDHFYGIKLLAIENLFFKNKTKIISKFENTLVTFKRKAIGISILGQFDYNDQIFFEKYSGECLSLHKKLKKFIPILLNAGKCSIESYKDDLRTFLLNNAGWQNKENTNITIKIIQGKLYFFDLDSKFINNNLEIQKLENLLVFGENKNLISESFKNNTRRIEKENLKIDSFFINLHEFIQSDIELYASNENFRLNEKIVNYEFSFKKDKTKYFIYLFDSDNKLIVKKITKNRFLTGRYFILGKKDNCFEIIREDVIYCKDNEINICTSEEMKFLVNCLVKKSHNEEIFYKINLNTDLYSDFRLDVCNTCKFMRKGKDVIIDLCIKQKYLAKDSINLLQKETSKIVCEGRIEKLFKDVNFRTFDGFFETSWKTFIEYFNLVD
ncbi:hypothetical protein GVAV_000246 [Gurleya vavrai]